MGGWQHLSVSCTQRSPPTSLGGSHLKQALLSQPGSPVRDAGKCRGAVREAPSGRGSLILPGVRLKRKRGQMPLNSGTSLNTGKEDRGEKKSRKAGNLASSGGQVCRRKFAPWVQDPIGCSGGAVVQRVRRSQGARPLGPGGHTGVPAGAGGSGGLLFCRGRVAAHAPRPGQHRTRSGATGDLPGAGQGSRCPQPGGVSAGRASRGSKLGRLWGGKVVPGRDRSKQRA